MSRLLLRLKSLAFPYFLSGFITLAKISSFKVLEPRLHPSLPAAANSYVHVQAASFHLFSTFSALEWPNYKLTESKDRLNEYVKRTEQVTVILQINTFYTSLDCY
jgi:hypothetical protein